jgi:hypothetical protein
MDPSCKLAPKLFQKEAHRLHSPYRGQWSQHIKYFAPKSLSITYYNYMRQDFEKLFTFAVTPEASDDLMTKVKNRINKEKKMKSLKFKAIFFGLCSVCSIILFVPAIQTVWHDFMTSGFVNYFSLLLSDSDSIAAYWQSFAMTLLESLPAVSMIALAFVTLAFLESIKLFTKNLQDIIS